LKEQEQNEDLQDEIWGTYEAFVNTVYEDLTVEGFTDTFAQTLTYGLFLAKLNIERNEQITLRNIDLQIPTTFALIKNIVGLLKYIKKDRYSKALWIVEELMSLINNLDLRAIQESLSFTNRKKKTDEEYKDPYLYFYENFLSEYNPKLRKSRGVYYTPHSVVRFIINAIDDVLKDKHFFGIRNGIADYENVNFLDFAAGTGTFLLEILEQLNDKKPFNKPEGNNLIKKHINNIYGFEFLIAPYAIAHLKLTQYLKENGFEVQDRLNIYLTNTLEDKDPQKSLFVPSLKKEGDLAQVVKRNEKILVITGNPPYSGSSENISFNMKKITKTYKSGKTREVKKKIDTWIGKMVKDYYKIENVTINENNPKWLQDDYVKFIRFAQYKIEQTGEGVVAIITNHSFLENPTFRGMRYNLMKAFDQILIIDLHGNSKKMEKTPEGEKDENVFDIQQGVCISVLIKKKGLKKEVKRADFWGKRDIKNKQLYETEFNNIDWINLDPTEPFYLFTKQNIENRSIYEKFFSVKEIFVKNSLGIVTGRDKLTIKNSFDEIHNTISEFIKRKPEDAREKLEIGKDVRDWQVILAQKDIKKGGFSIENIRQISYRLFDKRFTYFTGRSRGFQSMPRGEVMKNMLSENIALNVPRQIFRGSFKHVFISKNLTDANLLQSANGQTHFPLYVYDFTIDEKTLQQKKIKLVNFQNDFKKLIEEKYGDKFSPEQILAYIYGILHSPTYRKKYSDFLKIDFPRIPFCDSSEDFEKIVEIGQELINAHLMEEIPDYDIAETYDGEVGKDTVEKIEFRAVENVGRIYINKTNYFEPIPEEIFEFYIGGYKVIDKYLKERKGKDLQIEEIQQVKDIVKILAFTIEKMEEIDNVTNDIL
ncbi:MAG: N-6 DNA methylase, partial [Bacteroidetes bacterium]|nr:N-6 DNA methylase [Bacteroidota bacterium]